MNGDVDLRGGEVYVQPPRGWTRKGLMVTSIFDNGNDHWLSMDQNTSWPVVYHGFKNFDFVLPKVIKGNYNGGGLRPGQEAIYCSPKFEIALSHSGPLESNQGGE